MSKYTHAKYGIYANRLDDPHKGDQEPETHELVTELSADDRHLLEMIQKLLEPCDRITYGERQREVAAKLGKSVRTVRRLVKKWEQEGLAALQTTTRSDKAMSCRIRQAGKAISNRSILAEVRDRETFVNQKKTKKERQKAEQTIVQKAKKPVPVEPEEEIEVASVDSEPEYQMPEVFDYEQMREDYGW